MLLFLSFHYFLLYFFFPLSFFEPRNDKIITHYQRLLNYITPDVVHVMMEGRVVLSGGPELAARLEREGYAQLAEELGYDYKEEL